MMRRPVSCGATTGLLVVGPMTVWRGIMIGLAAGVLLGTVAGIVLVETLSIQTHRRTTILLSVVKAVRREVLAGAQGEAALGAALSLHDPRGRLGSAQSLLDRVDEVGPIGQMAAGWRLSRRFGVPWASLLSALAGDLDARVSASAARTAQNAGPRLSGYLLAGMPFLGLVLGVGMGAHPFNILFGTPVGAMLLLAGTSLTAAGLAWTARIVRS